MTKVIEREEQSVFPAERLKGIVPQPFQPYSYYGIKIGTYSRPDNPLKSNKCTVFFHYSCSFASIRGQIRLYPFIRSLPALLIMKFEHHDHKKTGAE